MSGYTSGMVYTYMYRVENTCPLYVKFNADLVLTQPLGCMYVRLELQVWFVHHYSKCGSLKNNTSAIKCWKVDQINDGVCY